MGAAALGATGNVYFASLDGSVYARNANTGAQVWTVATGSAVEAAPIIGNDGTIYVAGVVKGEWTLRRSSDGESWTTIDHFQANGPDASIPHAIAADAAGHVHVVGHTEVRKVSPEEVPEEDAAHWIVRSSSDGGRHFATTDDFNPKKLGEAKADSVAILPSGG